MKKIRLFLTILIGSISVLSLASCDSCSSSQTTQGNSEYSDEIILESSSEISAHMHTFGEWKRDETHHFKECACGERADVALHDYSAWQTTSDKHWKTCICGTIVENDAHSFGEWIVEDTQHYKACLCGEKADEEPHSFDTWEKMGDLHWEECVCGKRTEEKYHTYDGWCFGGEYHWKECVCGNKTQVGKHILDENNQCMICNMYYGTSGLVYERSLIGDYYVATVPEEVTLSGKVYVASVYDGKVVKGIGMYAFMGQSVEEIILPKSIEIIEKLAFAKCRELMNIDWKEGVREIGEGAFRACTKLKAISLPATLTSLQNHAFSECSHLESVSFADENDWIATTLLGEDSYTCTEDIFVGAAEYLTGRLLWRGTVNLAALNLIKVTK